MLEKLKNWFKKPEVKEEPKTEPKPKKTRTKKEEVKLSPKEMATAAGEPYIGILHVQVDPNDVNNGVFELDWNDKFILNLIKSGYKQRDDDTDQIIVDRWFQRVCRNIALEIYEQVQADPDNRSDLRVIRSRDLGNGRTEIS